MAETLGIAIGSTSVKACLLRDGDSGWAEVAPHDGDVRGAVTRILVRRKVATGTPAVVTGHEGRHQLRLHEVVKAVAFEHALDHLALDVRAIVSVGGEDLGVYTVTGRREIGNCVTGSKCAAGTGEFFVQQLRRMDLDIEAVHRPEVAAARVRRLSSRCSVFMKSDCTHALNKGEATREGIVLSLCHVMARKVIEFLGKARVDRGRILLAGGAFRNPHLTRFVRESLPLAECLTLTETPYLEALGAAHLASSAGTPLPPIDELFREGAVAFPRGAPLSGAAALVTVVPSTRTEPRAGRRYVLGVDGGSTTTKVALVDAETLEIAAGHYDRTLGDPVAALRRCLHAVREQVRQALGSDRAVRITLVATTGSSRELLGVHSGTPGVYNEIIAHTAGATHYDPAIDTIFEIGGQDAKYVSLRNHVPVDYAMNEACSAGTGSFLEESAAGDLDIHRADEIGPLALEAVSPLRFGEHCSAFINADIRKAIQQGATRPDIVAGLVVSVVSNYLNRVVGNRRIGDRIVLQGGVAKNPAVPLAFAQLLGKRVIVPPDPELMGCLGVARVALRKVAEGLLEEREYTFDGLLAREITRGKQYRCRACENDCPIDVMAVADEHYHFGGRCNKYANLRRAAAATGDGIDYVEVRRRLHFESFAPTEEDLDVRREVTVGIPDCFSVHTLWPLYSTFFHQLGVRVRRITEVAEAGVARGESNYCFPAEIAHGLMESLVRSDADFWFLPHLVTLPSYQNDLHACLCPLTQGLPYYLRTAFGADDTRILRPVLEFTRGFESGREAMVEVAARLGAGRDEALDAFRTAVETQEACYREGRRIGRQALDEAERGRRPVIVLLGRPYNAFTSTANMGIPRKFATRGYTVLPFDFLPIDDESIAANMYWYYGQQDLKAAAQVKAHPNLFACMVTNFSCAPDSFILHHLRWTFNTKPALVLELDSHTADAGIDTRIEAFLDIIEGYRSAQVEERPMMAERDWDVHYETDRALITSRRTGEALPLTDRRVTLVWPSMGRRGTELVSGICRSSGIDSVHQPTPTAETLRRARAVASGKECVPALLVLGSFLEYFARQSADPDRVYVLFMPITTGPCRTGQYAVFYQNLFQELGYRNIVVLSPNSDTSYRELGPSFSRRVWFTIVLADYLKDIEYSLRALAADPAEAMTEFESIWLEIVDAAGRGPDALLANLTGWARRLGRIPLARPLAEARRALVVGEIFVRQDDYSVETLIGTLTRRGIVPKVASISEWIHYLDWQLKRRLARAMAGMPLARRVVSPELRQYAILRIELAWKAWTEGRVRRRLALSGLIPDAPHDMDAIMRHVEEFASPDLDSEAVLSPCTGLVAAEEGYDGVAVIAPFACLPGRLIEALFAPWARARGLPVVCLENDGNAYPANVLSRLEVFACQVGRGAGASERPAPVDRPEPSASRAPRVPAAARPEEA